MGPIERRVLVAGENFSVREVSLVKAVCKCLIAGLVSNVYLSQYLV